MPNLTDRSPKALRLKPGQKDRIVFDSECPGLGVRLTASGSRVFVVQWTDRATRRKRRDPLGVWGAITIEHARTAARARLGEVARGVDPAAERQRLKQRDEADRAETACCERTEKAPPRCLDLRAIDLPLRAGSRSKLAAQR